MERNLLIQSMAESDRERLLALGRSIPFRQGQELQEAGQPVEAVLFPRSGVLSQIAVQETGADVETAAIGREGVVGAVAAFGSGRSQSRVTAKFDGEALAVSATSFRELYETSSSLRRVVALYTETLLSEARQDIACRTLHDVESRLARMLLTLSDKAGSTRLPLTQEAVADGMGVQRTTINAAAQKMKVSGALSWSRGVVLVSGRVLLEAHACSCYPAMRSYRQAMFGAGGAEIEPEGGQESPRTPGQPEGH